MRTIYFPRQKVMVFVAESHADQQVMMASAGFNERQGKLAVEPMPFAKFFGADARLTERPEPDEVPKMHGAKYADGSVVSADDMMGEPAQAGPADPTMNDVEPHPHGGITFGQRQGTIRALYRYHELLVGGGVRPGQLKTAVRQFIHSELVAKIVELSPTPTDDVILGLLRAWVPPPEKSAK